MKRTGYVHLQLRSFPLLLMMICGLAAFSEAQLVVYPTGDPARDVANVQAAVDHGGTVLLKAVNESGQPRAFNFGRFPVGWLDWSTSGVIGLGTAGQMVPDPDDPYVYYSLGNDVQIIGEQIVVRKGNTSETTVTTIEGGYVPIRNTLEREVPGAGPRFVFGMGRFSITGVRFLSPTYGTVNLHYGPTTLAAGRNLDVEISRCEFFDIQPALVYGMDGDTRVPFAWYAWGPLVMAPRGVVRMTHNRLSLTPGKFQEEMAAFESQVGSSQGLITFGPRVDTLAGPAEITGNEVLGFSIGIGSMYGMTGGQAHISSNDVTGEAYGIFCGGTGMKCLIEGNKVAGVGPWPDGIVVTTGNPGEIMQGSSITGNHIEMGQSEAGGITLQGRCVGNYVGQNNIKGRLAYALGILGDTWTPGEVAEENTFAGNNISLVQPVYSSFYGDGVHVFFDAGTRRNVLRGNSGTVRNLGIGNFITGTSVGGPPPKTNLGPGKLRKDLLSPAGMRFEAPR